MKVRSGYIPVDSMTPHRGLNSLTPSTLLDESFSPNCQDCVVTDGDLVKRKGYALLANLTNVGAADPVMLVVPFQRDDGTWYLLALTTKKQYVFTGSAWTDISTVAGDWTGDETNRFSYCITAGTDLTNYKAIFVTNGKNKPVFWDGHAAKFVDVTWNYPSFTTCATISASGDRLIIGDITAGGVRASQNIAWSAATTVNSFLDSVNGAGEQTLFDLKGSVQAIIPIAGYLAIYGDDSIHLMSYVGGDLIFTFQKLVEDTRLASSQGIVNLGSYHLFMSQDNIMLFDASQRLRTVGDVIHKTYRDELSSSIKSRAFAFLDRAKRRVKFGIPTSTTVTKIYQLDFDLVTPISDWKWTPHNYANRPLSFGFYVKSSDILWNDWVNTTWNELAQTWSAGSSTGGYPSLVFGGPAGQVYLADDSTFNDNGVAIDFRWDSKDFTVPSEYESSIARWTEIEFEAMGGSVDVYYSSDQGQSYVLAQSVTLNAQWNSYKVFCDFVGRTIRIRFRNAIASSDFQLRWVRPWLRSSGPR